VARIIRMKDESSKEEPIEEYIEDIKKGVINPLPYERLMIHYRKNKQFDDELKVIKKGIDVFKKFYSKQQSPRVKKKSKIVELSRKISKSAGLLDKKGNDIYLPEPLPRWIKRQSVTEQKLRKSKKK
jgi:hypothetical protein